MIGVIIDGRCDAKLNRRTSTYFPSIIFYTTYLAISRAKNKVIGYLLRIPYYDECWKFDLIGQAILNIK